MLRPRLTIRPPSGTTNLVEVTNLTELIDVTLTAVADNDLLQYDDATSKWVNQAIEMPLATYDGAAIAEQLVGLTASQTLTNKTLTSPVLKGAVGGWVEADETWTYASADDPTFTFTISGDKTGKYSVGMKLKLTQTTAKYFFITKVTFDDPGSTITIYGGTDYTLANAAFTSPYYSTQKAPHGFPLDPDKWTVKTTYSSDTAQTFPTQNTWYNIGTITIDVPIGLFNVDYFLVTHIYNASAINSTIQTTLSTANNSESDSEMTSDEDVVGSSTSRYLVSSVSRNKVLTLATKDTYYLNMRTTIASVNDIRIRGDKAPVVIRAVCAYL